jgi:uncharacterized protein (DUF736 family)
MGNGPKESRIQMSLQFVKVAPNNYITLDEKYSVRNIVGAGWIVVESTNGGKYFTLQIVEQSFKTALEAMSALREKVGA